MYIVVNGDGKIVASAQYAVDEEPHIKRGEKVIYIDDLEYDNRMVGNLYIDKFPYFQLPPSQFHTIENGTHVLPDDGIEKAWEHVRAFRSVLLSKCDWTQLPDVVLDDVDRIRWKELRTELRDITKMPDVFSALNVLNTYAYEIAGIRPTGNT